MSPYKKLEVNYSYNTEAPTYGVYLNIRNINSYAGNVFGIYSRAESEQDDEDANAYGIYSIATMEYDGDYLFGGYVEANGTHNCNRIYGLYIKGSYDGPTNSYGIYVEDGLKNYFEKPVGIGTTNPQSKLAVNGTITAKEVEVTSTGWPDHVFADNYRPMPLDEVEAYIHENEHLPGVPSAAEIEENGVSLGEMQAKLLEKVEELTLYVIELKKENEVLKERVTELER